MSALNFMAIHPPAAEIFQLVYSLQAEIYLKRKKKKEGRKEERNTKRYQAMCSIMSPSEVLFDFQSFDRKLLKITSPSIFAAS